MTNQEAINKLKAAEGDLISRAEAIDALDEIESEVADGYGYQYEKWRKYFCELPPAQTEQRWIPVTERLPEEDNWLGCSWGQFSSDVLVSILNSDDEDAWLDISHTIDGEWVLELPRYCQIVAWMPLPEPYAERREG